MSALETHKTYRRGREGEGTPPYTISSTTPPV